MPLLQIFAEDKNMTSIDGPGRSHGVAQTSDLDQARKSEATERKGKRPFAALQNRRGSVEKAVHAREKESGFKGKLDKNFNSNADDILRSMKARKGGKDQVTTRQHVTKQAATPAPPKPQRAPEQTAPQQAQQQAAARASVKAPPRPQRSEASKEVFKEASNVDLKGASKTLGRAGPTKPERSSATKTSATLPRPQAKPRTIFGAAAQEKTQPTPAVRTVFPQQEQTGAAKASASNYDVLTNVPANKQRGIQYPTMQKTQSGEQSGAQAATRSAERAPPRLKQRPLEGGQFLQGGGFNPAKTLNNPQAGQTLRGLEASVRTPAPPRLSIGTRIMNSLKAFFRVGTPVPQRTSVSLQGQQYSQLMETRLEDMLIQKPALSQDKQRVFEAAEREINQNLRSITRNVRDGEYTSQARQNVSNAMQRIENLFVEYETLEEALANADDNV